MDPITESKKLLVLVGSPRRNGNSALLAESVQRGAEEAGTQVKLRYIDDFITNFLRDCKSCRLPNGDCSIEDNFRTLFMEDFLTTDGVVFCSPIYWYGMSAQTKSFFDRTFCYYAAAYPDSAQVMDKMLHKRIGLVLASEETYPGVTLGIVHQLQEYSRYTHSEFIGVVHGIGNRRGEVADDPASPLDAAERLGRDLFKRSYSDYRSDTERSKKVWASGSAQ